MSSEQKNILITSAVRTAIGTFGGSLKYIQAHELGSFVIRKAMEKEAKQKQILEEFDPTDRTKNAHGGLINILKL